MLIIPDEFDLLSFFESEPVDSAPEDGFYCYKVVDDRGMELYFSVNLFEASVQARLVFLGVEAAVISEEGGKEVKIEKDSSGEYLVCVFGFSEVESQVSIYLRPDIKIKWHTLKK